MPVPLKSTNTDQKAGLCCVIPFMTVWTGFAVFWTLAAHFGGAPWWFVLFGVPFILIGSGVMYASVRGAMAGKRFGPPEATASRDTLRPGEEFSFSYRQKLKDSLDIQSLRVQLVLREEATYSSGSSSTTVKHDESAQGVFREARSYRAGEEIHEDLTFQIPPDAMHTFTSAHNKLRWMVAVEAKAGGNNQYVDAFEVRVLPERTG